MADHDLGFRGFPDYWKRAVRCGATYAEIASRCRRTPDPLWLREAVVNAAWAVGFVAAVLLLVAGPLLIQAIVAAAVLLVLGRKFLQMVRRKYPVGVAAVYALHCYFSKLPIAWGEFRWVWQRVLSPAKGDTA